MNYNTTFRAETRKNKAKCGAIIVGIAVLAAAVGAVSSCGKSDVSETKYRSVTVYNTNTDMPLYEGTGKLEISQTKDKLTISNGKSEVVIYMTDSITYVAEV